MRHAVAIVLASFAVGTAHAETVRFVCTNAEGAPDMFEIDFVKHTVLEYNKQDNGSIAPDTGETPMPAAIGKTLIGWPDSLDGTKYTLSRSTGVLKKWFEGSAIYTKQCRTVPVGATDWQ
jgi:hypothetical protein